MSSTTDKKSIKKFHTLKAHFSDSNGYSSGADVIVISDTELGCYLRLADCCPSMMNYDMNTLKKAVKTITNTCEIDGILGLKVYYKGENFFEDCGAVQEDIGLSYKEHIDIINTGYFYHHSLTEARQMEYKGVNYSE